MNNFTPEYIELAKNSKVQELKLKLNAGEWFYDESYKQIDFEVEPVLEIRPKYHIWLPTSGDLDDAIVKICDENNIEYSAYYQGDWVINVLYDGSEFSRLEENDKNPLIAKISLLISLLEGE